MNKIKSIISVHSSARKVLVQSVSISILTNIKMRQILPLRIQETVPNPRPAARCVVQVDMFQAGGREVSGNAGPHGVYGSGNTEA